MKLHRLHRLGVGVGSLAAALFLSASPSGCSCEPPAADAGPTPGADAGPGGQDAGPPPEGLVAPTGAVACELLLTETGSPVRVVFGEETRGTSVHESPRVAVAAVSDDGAIDIAVAGGFALEESRCVDAAGADVGEMEVAR